MLRFLAKIWETFIQLLYRRTVLVLTLLFCIGIGIAMENMERHTSKTIKAYALQTAANYATAMQEARTLYSAEAIVPAMATGDIRAAHDYTMEPDTIPLPATFLIELGERIHDRDTGISVRLYSDFPFPWRQDTGGPQDDFEQDALAALRQDSDTPYYRRERMNGEPVFRYAEADLLKPSCVSCHNTYPGTPNTNWKIGDVRGVLEIIQPLSGIQQEVREGTRETSLMLGGFSVLGISGIAIVIGRLRQVSKELERRVDKRTEQLRQEQEKTDQLLLSILPEVIAQRLKDGENHIADGFGEASILFADLVGFTTFSQERTPQELLGLLNQLFSTFDRLCDRHHLEKIKTIGDAYMLVGGLPNFSESHPQAVANMALDMQKEIDKFNLQYGTQLQLRIGIEIGPVVAGVIGKKKFAYDLWGDTVNTASRMESHSLPGKIQVTEKVYQHLKNYFQFEARGKISVKGKGEMFTYFLEKRKVEETKVAGVLT
ncbi:MAG: adenylate/guanylate cyclase domain-containing protein [Microcoleaceae cyanobacterium]